MYSSVYSGATRRGVFLSQAALRFDLAFVQAGHHLWFVRCTKKATRLGRPRLARYAARELARTPPSEGFDVGRPTLRFEGAPARCRRRDGRRLDEVHVAVGWDQHGVVVIAGPGHRSNLGGTQGFLED